MNDWTLQWRPVRAGQYGRGSIGECGEFVAVERFLARRGCSGSVTGMGTPPVLLPIADGASVLRGRTGRTRP